ncbi:hypothetical protein [Nonomuraea sp. NPDC050783]|uniref:hypothetical protein n=1 Tax=Nonomuraea sp. NPDC050783 TaxID=3154634 RepID=UPI003467A0B1
MLHSAPQVMAGHLGQTIIAERAGARLFKPLRQTIARSFIKILALTTAIWHNGKTNQPTNRSLTAYDH